MKLRRAIVVLMSAQGQGVPNIAHLLDCSPEYVRGVIHDFNDRGFDALNPKWSGCRPKTISEAVRRHIRLIELVSLPTYASWLNWIETEFAALRYFALSGTDHRTHTEQGEAIAAYLRWRNARAEPKRDFAPESTIRTWTDYKINVA